MYIIVDVSGWATVLTYVGGGASISAAASLCSSQMFGVFLVQITSNKAKNQCRNMDREAVVCDRGLS
jgi:hypothetical protein